MPLNQGAECGQAYASSTAAVAQAEIHNQQANYSGSTALFLAGGFLRSYWARHSAKGSHIEQIDQIDHLQDYLPHNLPF